MLSKLLIAWTVMALCVVIHASGLATALRWLRQHPGTLRFWRWTWLFICIAGWVILLHPVEVTAWALAYYWTAAIGDVQSAFYFSSVTYTTTGYGDLVLPEDWRLVGGIEALTGILMSGWSTAFFFAVVSRMHGADVRTARS